MVSRGDNTAANGEPRAERRDYKQKNRRALRPGGLGKIDLLGQIVRDELRHFEHRDLGFTTEDGLQLVIGIDLGPDLLVLETILLDVSPELLGELGAWEGI